jgi:phage terminase large subunit-like protein
LKECRVIPGDLIDDDVIENKLRELCDPYDVRELIFDPKFAAKMMARLAEDDLRSARAPAPSTVSLPARWLRAARGRRSMRTRTSGRKGC